MTDCIYEEHRKDNDEKSKGDEKSIFSAFSLANESKRKITCSFSDEIWMK